MARLRPYATPTALLVLCAVLYANSLRGSFQFDDATSIVSNPAIRSLDPRAWWAFWPGRIVSYASFALNYAAGQLEVPGYHLVNLLVHAAAGIAAWAVVRRLVEFAAPGRDARWVALAAGAIFCAHPLQTQAVSYVVQRSTSLGYALYFAAIAFHLAALRRSMMGEKDLPWRVGALLCTGAAVLSKESMLSLPFAVLLVDAIAVRGVPGRLRRIAPYFLVGLGLPLLVVLTGGSRFGVAGGSLGGETQDVERWTYFWTQASALARYLGLLVWPVGQNVDHELAWRHSPIDGPTPLFLLLHAALIGLGILLVRRGRRLEALGILWFYLLLAPSSSLFPIRDPIFEHRLYGALLGPALLAGLAIERLARRHARGAAFVLCMLVVLLGGLTVHRNRVWATPLSLWEDSVAKSPHKARPRTAFAAALGQAGRLPEARRELEAAVRLDPNYAPAWNNLGQLKVRMGEPAAGLDDLRRATELDPRSDSAWFNLAVALARSGELPEAEFAYRRTLELRPRSTPALNGLAAVRLQRGDPGEAARLADQAAALGDAQPRLREAIRRAGGRP